MKPKKDRRIQLLDYLREYVVAHDCPPSQREIADELGINKFAVQKHLKVLEEAGHVRIRSDIARGIQLLVPYQDSLPVIGSVAAGTPIEAEENIESWVPVPAEWHGRKRPNVLMHVKGNSMSGPPSNINDGDLIGVYSAQTADPRKVVVFAVPSKKTGKDELTVKEFMVDNGELVLIPHNRDLEPMRYNPEDVRVVGIYSGLLVRRGSGRKM